MCGPGSPRLVGAAAFAASLAAYLATLPPSLAPGHDSAELTTAAALPGIAHPPGYPLYTMLGWIVTRVAPGDPAWDMNLFSALAMALAVGLAGVAFARFTGSPMASLAASLAFAFARTPWRLAVQAEVFALHLALVAALLVAAASWRDADEAGRRRWFAGMGLLVGLGLAHHQTVVLVLPPLAAFLWLARGGRPAGLTPWAAVTVAAGLLPYLYLPLRARAHPALDWGHPDTPARLWWALTRSGYGSLRLSTASGSAPATGVHLEACLASLALRQFPVLGALAGVAGGILAALRRRPEGVLFGGLWLLAGPAWAVVGAQPAGEGYFDMMERFYAASYLGFAGLVALGLAEMGARLAGKWRGLVLVVPLAGLLVNFGACSERGQHHVPDALAAMLDPLPAGALVVTGSDLSSGAVLYARLVEGRPVEQVLPGLLKSSWYLDQLPAERAEAARRGGLAEVLAAARARGVPVYLDYLPPEVPGFFVPEGLLYRYLAPSEPLPDRVQASKRSLEILDSHPRRGDYRIRPGGAFWRHHLVRTWAWAYATAGEGLVETDPEEASRALEIAVGLDPDAAPAWAALGQARLGTGRAAAAGEAFRRAVVLDPGSRAAMAGLVRVAELEGRTEEAERWRERLR